MTNKITKLPQVIEALADGGVMMGLPRDLAMEHAAAMVEGAAGMCLSQGKHPAHLKDEVRLLRPELHKQERAGLHDAINFNAVITRPRKIC